jgi:Family of unknown function (DUF6510)
MNQDICRLDGNAAGGVLAQLFAGDATTMVITCGHCAATSALGALHAYGGRMGVVLRCTKCGGVNLRASLIKGVLRVDFPGSWLHG